MSTTIPKLNSLLGNYKSMEHDSTRLAMLTVALDLVVAQKRAQLQAADKGTDEPANAEKTAKDIPSTLIPVAPEPDPEPEPEMEPRPGVKPMSASTRDAGQDDDYVLLSGSEEEEEEEEEEDPPKTEVERLRRLLNDRDLLRAFNYTHERVSAHLVTPYVSLDTFKKWQRGTTISYTSRKKCLECAANVLIDTHKTAERVCRLFGNKHK